jgi:Nitroreductase family
MMGGNVVRVMPAPIALGLRTGIAMLSYADDLVSASARTMTPRYRTRNAGRWYGTEPSQMWPTSPTSGTNGPNTCWWNPPGLRSKEMRSSQMLTTRVDLSIIRNAVEVACRAPSFHNSQPWRWVAAPGGLHLLADPDRILNTDRSGREALVSCGAVLDHLCVAMAAAGWTADVTRFPDPDNARHVASVDFTPLPAVTGTHRRRADAILRRRSDRLPFAAPPDWDAVDPALRDAVDSSVALLTVVDDDLRPQLVDAAQITESLRMYDSAYHAELDWWTAPFVVSDGIPQSALVSAAENDRVGVGRNFPVMGHRDRRQQVPEDASTILVLSAAEDTRDAILGCGQALSAVLLECTMAGLATCTVSHITELAAGRNMISAVTGTSHPQLLIRVGIAPTTEELPPPTPRRPLSDVFEVRPDLGGKR